MRILVPPFVQSALRLLRESGFEAYIVGGCVRDSLLRLVPKDWDITTNATPPEIARVFAAHRIFAKNRRFGTVSVLFAPSESVEITTYRSESGYTNCRHPDSVRFVGDIHQDLKRRDFTINALAYEPFSDTLLDDFYGIEHLNARQIVCVGEPHARFGEDALRIMRAVRFCATKGFALESRTRAALLQSLPLLAHISVERKREELNAMLLGDSVLVLRDYAPVLRAVFGATWQEPHWNLLANLSYNLPRALPESLALESRLTALLLSSPNPQEILQHLRYNNAQSKRIAQAIAHYPLQSAIPKLQKALFMLGQDCVQLLAALGAASGDAAILPNLALALQGCHNLAMLNLKGDDVLAAGIQRQHVGAILRDMLALVIEGRIANERGALLCALHDKMCYNTQKYEGF
ncbi:MAG: hypothetical protein K2N70_07050 [Helicobacter sp.]|nr:hypothetical protein [Helicobacter sp.]